VPSSISNFNARRWGQSWVLALVVAVLILGALEVFWRSNGHRPSIVDDQRLWAMERNKIGKSQNEIALLGSSRMQTDISTATLRQVAPNYSIINLSADSTCANATLSDLAGDSNFKGTVILETTSECIMFGDEHELSQQFYVDYFHKTYNLNVKLSRQIATFVQKSLTVVDPYLNLIKVAGDLIAKKKLRTPNYLNTYEDRTRAADYTKLDINQHKATRISKIDTHYRQLSSRISTELLTEQLAGLDDAVKKIQNRGGKVVFVRFPVSDEHWEIDEQYFPRSMYWDTIIPKTGASVVHFKDIDEVNNMQCPDTSHLDVRDTKAFTTKLFNILREENKI
jgi:hypothetical protein